MNCIRIALPTTIYICLVFFNPIESHAKKTNVDVFNGEKLYRPCITCHGKQGEGNQNIKSPSLAGQEGWYIKRQLKNFRAGIRGAHPKDLYGQLMRPMSLILKSNKEIDDVIAYILTFKAKPKKATIKGNISQGQQLYGVCATCHGSFGQGNKSTKAPALRGQDDWYLYRQIQNFKKGIRGTHSKDKQGKKMQVIARSLNDQAIASLVMYIKALKLPVAKKKKGNIFDGKRLYRPCITCHGKQGEGNQNIKSPSLAGQEGWYMKRQLKNFRAGVRGTHSRDLYGQLMRPMSLILKSNKEIDDVIAYILTFKAKPKKATIKGNAVQGQQLYGTCATCHGTKGEGNKATKSPSLSNLDDWYLYRQLQNFKKGIRGGHSKDKQGKQMRPIAQTLSRSSIADLVVYIKALQK